MELYQIRYFLAAADTLNFTKAAERCFVTQPTLTRAIKKLEDDLGGQLFHRERSHMQLTELGREMCTHFASINQQTHEAHKAARQLLRLASGEDPNVHTCQKWTPKLGRSAKAISILAGILIQSR